ncbi:MAG: hypothetical protein D6795_20320, partial [Deltaproteobacteria bacterium]
GGHDPDAYREDGCRDIGATDCPAFDVYDSNDPAALERHLEEIAGAGIDFLVVSWWGIGSFEDQAFAHLLAAIEASGSPLSATIYYEVVPEGDPARAIEDLTYIRDTYAASPAFFDVDGEPVVFIYGRAVGQLSPQGWRSVFESVEAQGPVHVSFDWPADADRFDPPSGVDSVHFYNPVGDLVSGAYSAGMYESYVAGAHRAGLGAALTVLPGYDDSNIGREHPIVLPREGGAVYEMLWKDAIAADPDWVLVTTFNEWHEGSEIEPSIEYGDTYLRLTADYADHFHP